MTIDDPDDDDDPERSDCQTIALAAWDAGNQRAPGELLEAVEPIIRRALRARLDPQDLGDVVQEALVRLTRRFARWDPEQGRFPSWAAAVARNLAVDYRRRQEAAHAVLGDDVEQLPDPGAIDAIVAVDDAELVQDLFGSLRDSGDSQALKVLAAMCDLLAAGDDTTYAAIGERAGVSEATVGRALVRIRAALKNLRTI